MSGRGPVDAARHLSSERLSAYLDGELSAAEAELVERQLEASAEGRVHLDGLRSVVEGLRDLEPAPPPPALDRIVFERVHLEKERKSLLDRLENQLGRFQHQNPTWVLLAVVLALGIFAYFLSWGAHVAQGPEVVVVGAGAGEHVIGTRLEAAGRALFWDGEVWREPGTEGRPERHVVWDGAEAADLRAAHPALGTVDSIDEPLVLLLGEDVVRLTAGEARPPAAGEAERGDGAR